MPGPCHVYSLSGISELSIHIRISRYPSEKYTDQHFHNESNLQALSECRLKIVDT